jgi:hypothetical protein
MSEGGASHRFTQMGTDDLFDEGRKTGDRIPKMEDRRQKPESGERKAGEREGR